MTAHFDIVILGGGLNGAWGWAIPKSSPDPEAAWTFLKWIESPEIAKKRAMLGGSPLWSDADWTAVFVLAITCRRRSFAVPAAESAILGSTCHAQMACGGELDRSLASLRESPRLPERACPARRQLLAAIAPSATSAAQALAIVVNASPRSRGRFGGAAARRRAGSGAADSLPCAGSARDLARQRRLGRGFSFISTVRPAVRRVSGAWISCQILMPSTSGRRSSSCACSCAMPALAAVVSISQRPARRACTSNRMVEGAG